MITTKDGLTEENLHKEMQEIIERTGLNTIEEALYFPKHLQIETTRLCNAHCTFCPVDEWDKTTTFMSDELFDKIVEEFKLYTDWIDFVSVHRAGEPLIDKKISQRVKKLSDIGIRHISLSTNASILTEKKSIELINAGLHEIMLSIDSVDKEPYEKLRVGLDYDRVIKNIRTLFRVRNDMQADMVIRVRGVSFYDLNKPEHRQEIKRWEDFWGTLRKPQDRIYMKRAHNWGNQIELGDSQESDDVYHPCIVPWSNLHVTAMGKVPLCPQDYDGAVDIGDINTHSIAEVWRNAKWAEIRKMHASGKRNDISFCQGCRMFDDEKNHLENWEEKNLSVK